MINILLVLSIRLALASADGAALNAESAASSAAAQPTLPSSLFLIQETGEVDGMKYRYFVGWLNAEHTKKYRAVFGSVGSISIPGQPAAKLGIDPPQVAGNSTAELSMKVVEDGDSFHFELVSGWAGVEYFDVAPGENSAGGSTSPVAPQPAPMFRALFPVPWRFITTGGLRTGATSSRFFVLASGGKVGADAVKAVCFSDEGSVLAAFDSPTTNTSAAPGTESSGTAARGLSEPAMKPGTLVKLTKPAASDTGTLAGQDTSPTDRDQFVAQARYFLQRAKERYEK